MTTEEKITAAPPEGSRNAPAPKKKRKKNRVVKRIISLVLVLAILAGGAYAMWYFLFREEAGLATIVPATAMISSIQSTASGNGNARAGATAAITITANGVVQELFVQPGDVVTEGQPLYNMNSPDAEAAVTAAEKAVTDQEKNIESLKRAITTAERNVTAAEKALTLREAELEDRYAAIEDRKQDVEDAKQAVEDRKQDVLDRKEDVTEAEANVEKAKQDVLDRKADVETAKKAVEDAKAALALRRAELEELRASASSLSVLAPFAGKLIDVQPLAAGQSLSAGEVIAKIVDDSRFKVQLYFSYAYINSVSVGQSAVVSLPSTMGTVEGKVEEIHKVNFISPEGASFFEVVISFANPGTLTQDMLATATLTAPDGTPVYPYGSGEIKYFDTVEIKAALSGSVKEVVTLRNYTDVTAGQVLVTQNPDDLDKAIEAKEDEVDSAEKAVTAAEEGVTAAENAVSDAEKYVTTTERLVTAAERAVSDAEKAVTDAEKNVELAEAAVVTAQTDGIQEGEQNIEDAKADIEYAKQGVVEANQAVEDGYARLEELKEALVTAQGNLLNFNAVAPISGTVTSCTIEEGMEVTAGSTVITITDTTNMVVEITVDDRNIPYITPGMEVQLSDWNGMTYIGTVTKIDMENSQSSGAGMTTYPVTLTVENYSGSLLQGMWLDYSFVTSESPNCVTVPIACVKNIVDTEGNPHTVVFIQSEEKPENTVEFDMPEYYGDTPPYPSGETDGYWAIDVETGLNDRYNVEITSGLSEGDVVFQAFTMTGAWSY